MAGSKAAKGAAAKAAEAKRAKDAAAAAAAAAEAEADDEDWVVDMTTPVELDAAPPARKPVAMPALPPLPDGEETDEARAARVGKDAETIKRAKSIRDGRAVLGAKISSGPYGESARKSHWDYVLIEMRWMANDFAAERDWKAECARRCGSAVAAAKGVPKPLAAEDAETTKKRACARVAAEVAAFWSKAWDRATKKPIPTAAELVPPPAGEAEGAGAGAATTNGGAVVAAADLSKTDSGRATRGAAAAETTQAKTTPPKAEKQEAAPADVVMAEADGDAKANGGDAKGAFAPADSAAAAADVSAAPSESDFQTPMAAIRAKSIFPKTPPPPPGVKVIEQWACTKLVADIARLKRRVIRDAMREKEEEEEGDKKGAKKGAKKGGKGGGKKKAAPTRGRRGRSAKDESEEEEEEEDEEEEEEDARAAADGDVKPADATTTEADVVASAAAAAMPPPPPVYLPGGVPDAILDAELNLASVAPGTPPRVDEDPHAFPPVAYECYGTATTRWWTRSIGAEAMKFAEYERRLRDWEESEKRRQRAVVDAARFSAEAEEYRRAHERRRAVAAAQAQARARPPPPASSTSTTPRENGRCIPARVVRSALARVRRRRRRILRTTRMTASRSRRCRRRARRGIRKNRTRRRNARRGRRDRGRRWRTSFCAPSCTSLAAIGDSSPTSSRLRRRSRGCIDARSSADGGFRRSRNPPRARAIPTPWRRSTSTKGPRGRRCRERSRWRTTPRGCTSIAPRRRRRDTSNCDDNTPPNERGTTCRDVRPRTNRGTRIARCRRRIRSNWRTRR